ncbi:hypothetical protein [Streptomyces lannensis]|uniref:hypothetical protein n=1 Tax=Streptomyces lannensis TaxID=766498 RepID=UPI0031E78344
MLLFAIELEVPNWTLYRLWRQAACETRKSAARRNSTSGTGHSAIATTEPVPLRTIRSSRLPSSSSISTGAYSLCHGHSLTVTNYPAQTRHVA